MEPPAVVSGAGSGLIKMDILQSLCSLGEGFLQMCTQLHHRTFWHCSKSVERNEDRPTQRPTEHKLSLKESGRKSRREKTCRPEA